MDFMSLYSIGLVLIFITKRPIKLELGNTHHGYMAICLILIDIYSAGYIVPVIHNVGM